MDLNSVRTEVARLFRAWRAHDRIAEAEQARLVGQVLYRAVFPGQLAADFESHLFDPTSRVHVSLHFADGTDLDLLHLPWEQMFVPEADTRAGVAIGARDGASLARVLSADPSEHAPPGRSRLSTLLLEAPNLGSQRRSGVAVASAQLAKALPNALPHDVIVMHEGGGELTQIALADLLGAEDIDVLHYIGYGRFQGTVDQLALSGDDEDGIDWLGVDGLADCLGDKPPMLVVLQTCGGPVGTVPGDLSVFAPRLLKGGVENVLAWQFPLGDEQQAIRLIGKFYEELARGEPVRDAVQSSRRLTKLRPWNQPALFARSPGDTRLVAAGSRRQTTWGQGLVHV